MVVVCESEELDSLCGRVCGVASEEEVVSGLNAPCESHKDGRVGAESAAHGSGDHLFILGQIGNGCERKTPVGNGTPEVRRLCPKEPKMQSSVRFTLNRALGGIGMTYEKVLSASGRLDPVDELRSHDV
jgi:hypothetical protein